MALSQAYTQAKVKIDHDTLQRQADSILVLDIKKTVLRIRIRFVLDFRVRLRPYKNQSKVREK